MSDFDPTRGDHDRELGETGITSVRKHVVRALSFRRTKPGTRVRFNGNETYDARRDGRWIFRRLTRGGTPPEVLPPSR